MIKVIAVRVLRHKINMLFRFAIASIPPSFVSSWNNSPLTVSVYFFFTFRL